jgi:hypothetical protein
MEPCSDSVIAATEKKQARGRGWRARLRARLHNPRCRGPVWQGRRRPRGVHAFAGDRRQTLAALVGRRRDYQSGHLVAPAAAECRPSTVSREWTEVRDQAGTAPAHKHTGTYLDIGFRGINRILTAHLMDNGLNVSMVTEGTYWDANLDLDALGHMRQH